MVSVGAKAQAVLAVAAAADKEGTDRHKLVSLLWPEYGEARSRSALRQCLHHLRYLVHQAGVGLLVEGERVALQAVPENIDTWEFAACAAEGSERAARLYRGEFLEGLFAEGDLSAWLEGERCRLRELAYGLLERIADRAAASPSCVALGYQLLRADPLHEGCYRAMMRLHAAAGNRAKALALYEECARQLHSELGIQPSQETSRLAAGYRAEPEPHVLPAEPTETFGRRRLGGVQGKYCGSRAFDHVLRGMQLFQHYTDRGNRAARAEFVAAAEQDADYTHAIALVGWTHWMDAVSGWSEDPQGSLQLACWWCERALAADRQRHPSALALSGKLLLWGMQHEEALARYRHAVAINPASAYLLFHLAEAETFAGLPEQALAGLSQALRLNQNDHGAFLTIEGLAYYLSRRLETAALILRRAVTRNPTYSWAHGILAACLADMRQLDEARDAARRAKRLNRRFSVQFIERTFPLRKPSDRKRMGDAWAYAGMPREDPLGDGG